MLHFEDDFSPKGAVVDGKWYACDWSKANDIESRLHCFFDFARERHAVYLRRALGLPKPWTNDPILQGFRFCNIYRELDTVSQWIYNNVIVPYEDDPNLWFMLCASRIINWPDSLQAMMDVKGGFGIKGLFSPDIAYGQLKARRKAGLKTITGAYIVNSVTSKKDPEHIQGDKLAYICYRTLGEIWPHRAEIAPVFKESLETAVQTLKRFNGYGPFMAYQIVVDLTYSKKWLGKSKDLNTFNSAGPGTHRGLSRVFHGQKFVLMTPQEKTRLLLFQLKASNNSNYWPNTSSDMKKGFAPISLSNMSNINCEADKHARLFLGEGKMRSTYPGKGNTVLDSQRSLF